MGQNWNLQGVKTMIRQYEEEANTMIEAIKLLASNEETLNNFQHYLAECGGRWFERFVKDFECLASEFNHFVLCYRILRISSL